jgi:hypothetical protein
MLEVDFELVAFDVGDRAGAELGVEDAPPRRDRFGRVIALSGNSRRRSLISGAASSS